MLHPAATTIMDDIFSAMADIDDQIRLLGVMQDFLTRQAEKNTDTIVAFGKSGLYCTSAISMGV
jgi:hypothetical protein